MAECNGFKNLQVPMVQILFLVSDLFCCSCFAPSILYEDPRSVKVWKFEQVTQIAENSLDNSNAIDDKSEKLNRNLNAYRARKVAFITGVTGQDGSYLAELLLSKGYKVHGLVRHNKTMNHIDPSITLHYGDMTDSCCLVKLIGQIQPTEVYHLAAQSHVQVSFEMPEYTAQVDALGTLRLLDAIFTCGLTEKIRFYQASTSELFGNAKEVPQKETTLFHPRSPYAVAKLFSYWTAINYREAFRMFSCNGISFIHESPRRGETFVTRKITQSVAKIFLGQQDFLELGNINSKRDWGHAREYVEAMWLILQQDTPDDFVIATGKSHSVRQFVEYAFEEIGKTIVWEGSGVNEIGKEEDTNIVRVKINAKFYRPTESEELLGDATKAKTKLNWETKIGLAELVKEMVASDLKLLQKNSIA